jgi:hypothetical protein
MRNAYLGRHLEQRDAREHDPASNVADYGGKDPRSLDSPPSQVGTPDKT